jgi:hypothetical protein
MLTNMYFIVNSKVCDKKYTKFFLTWPNLADNGLFYTQGRLSEPGEDSF